MLLGMNSCLTESKIAHNCDRFARVCGDVATTTIVRKDTTIYIHDTIKVKLPADSIHINGVISIDSGVANMKPITKTFGIITANAFILNNQLDVRAWINRPSLLIARMDTIKIPGAIRETTVDKVIPVRFIPKLYKWCFGIILGQVVLLILLLLKKLNIFNPINILAKLIGK